jgi:hypothetical protein
MYRIASASKKGIAIFEFEQKLLTSKLIHKIDSIAPKALSWSPDNTVLGVLLNAEILFVHLDGEKVQVESVPTPNVSITCCTFGFKSGRYFYLGSEGCLYVFDRLERKYLNRITVIFFN